MKTDRTCYDPNYRTLGERVTDWFMALLKIVIFIVAAFFLCTGKCRSGRNVVQEDRPTEHYIGL